MKNTTKQKGLLYKPNFNREDGVKMNNRYLDLENELTRLNTHYYLSNNPNHQIIHSVIKMITNELQTIREINMGIVGSDEEYSKPSFTELMEKVDMELKNILEYEMKKNLEESEKNPPLWMRNVTEGVK